MNRLLSTLLVVCTCLNSFAQDTANSTMQEELIKQSKLLVQVGNMLESNHYSPKVIDDNYSKAVWERYINKLDAHKDFFLQRDIGELKKYQTTLDDEIHGKLPITFIHYIVQLYGQRLAECTQLYRQLLSTPFHFNKREQGLPATVRKVFPVSENERMENSRKRIKYMVLQTFVALQKQRSVDKPGGPLYSDTDTELERMARETCAKNMELQMKRLEAGLNEEKQFVVYVSTIVRYMDPHSDYLPPADTRGYQEAVSNKFFGTGARMLEKDGFVYINDMEPGSPALKGGQVQIGDIITAVGQNAEGEMTDVTGMPPAEIAKLVRGDKGTIVRLCLKKADGSLKTVAITRDEIVPGDGRVRIALVKHGDQKTGYILLPGFYDDTKDPNGPHCARDVAEALKIFNAEHVDGVIMDLRTNGGGSFREAVSMIRLFVKSGPVVQTRDRNAQPVSADDPSTSQVYPGPLVVSW